MKHAASPPVASFPQPSKSWRGGWVAPAAPSEPEEVPVAMVIDGSAQAVLMATPHELEDFALGFALTEGMIASPADVQGIEVVPVAAKGGPAVEARLWLRPGIAAKLAERRRSMLGPVGCGLCGLDSVNAALPEVISVGPGIKLHASAIGAIMAALRAAQIRWRETPAIHAAGFWHGNRMLLREDVGRHNALDKLAGALARADLAGGGGAVVMSSRLSVDLVQKSARIGAGILIGAGAPTRLALDWAGRAGITLIGRARAEGDFDLYTHPQRIEG